MKKWGEDLELRVEFLINEGQENYSLSRIYMPVNNRNFIIEDLPPDPEDLEFPDDDEDDLEDTDLDEMDEEISSGNDELPFDSPRYAKPISIMEETRSYPWNTRSWGSEQQTSRPWTPAYQTPVTNPWSQRSSLWSDNLRNSTAPRSRDYYNQTGQFSIDRKKTILFVDLLDILIESESVVREQNSALHPSNNYRNLGVMPRGLYDVRLKLEVWSKLMAFSPDYVFCISNQAPLGKENQESWDFMIKYVMRALAEYLRLPTPNCRCLIKYGFSRNDPEVKPGTGLIKKALSLLPSNYRYQRDQMVVIGANSGYANQSNIDRAMAEKAGIDYVDVMDLLTAYN